MSSSPPPRRLITPRQLIMLAIAITLALSKTVPAKDISFAALSIPYLYLLSLAYPRPKNSSLAPVFGAKNAKLNAYMLFSAVIGLALPIGYLVYGVVKGEEKVKAAAPHLFLLVCQVFMEGVTFNQQFSLPMRAFIPIFYNTMRLFTISDWLSATESMTFASALAIVNMAFWAFNLFGFLLPVYLPKVMKLHYGHSQQA